MITVLPIHIDKLGVSEIFKIIRVCLTQNIVNDRLFKYFIYPKIEKKVSTMKLSTYIETLNILADLGYEEDKVFWIDHILPAIFNYNYTQNDAVTVWEALLKVKINCPTVDLAKFVLVMENLVNEFKNLKSRGENIDDLLLSIDEKYRPVAKKKESMSLGKVKETEKRLKYQHALEHATNESENMTMEESFTNILNIKDWNKAKYDIEQNEMKKARALKEEELEAKKKLEAEKKEARKEELAKAEAQKQAEKAKAAESSKEKKEAAPEEPAQDVEIVEKIPKQTKSIKDKILSKFNKKMKKGDE